MNRRSFIRALAASSLAALGAPLAVGHVIGPVDTRKRISGETITEPLILTEPTVVENCTIEAPVEVRCSGVLITGCFIDCNKIHQRFPETQSAAIDWSPQ